MLSCLFLCLAHLSRSYRLRALSSRSFPPNTYLRPCGYTRRDTHGDTIELPADVDHEKIYPPTITRAIRLVSQEILPTYLRYIKFILDTVFTPPRHKSTKNKMDKRMDHCHWLESTVPPPDHYPKRSARRRLGPRSFYREIAHNP